ncbi:MAG: hypothetical protein M3220_01295 [Chloroflexota bacterium]|nr:hypothetical protein [Chloroflexota bacterium]
MKRVILSLIILLLLVACSRGTASPGGEITSSETSPYQLLVSSADLAAGSSRLALTLWDGPERLSGVQEMDVTIFRLDEDYEVAEQVWEGPAKGYEMGNIEYWVSYPEFPEAGNYGIQTLFTTADGAQIENRALVTVKAEPEAPAIGEAAPRSETRTLEDAPIEELSSGGPYVDRFYQMTVAEAAESGNPAIVGFITPGHCSSALCAPVLQSVADASEELDDDVNVVHVEIYRNFAENELDPAVTEWNLPSEPWVFVLDSDGTIAARLDGPVSPEELIEAVREVQDG